MHFTEYYAIVERDHEIQNPSSPEKLRLLADYCRVRDGLRVLDVGSGKGWLMCDWASRWAIDATGLEINPWFVAAARERARMAGVGERVRFVEGPALEFAPAPASYDIVTCIGASFALGSFDGAIAWMHKALRPGGVLAIGEPFANETPPADLLALWSAEGAGFQDLAGTAGVLEAHGLELNGLIVAAADDWDRYESPKWRAAREWAQANPDHPLRAELLSRDARNRERYLRWERRYLGWAIFVARPVGDGSAGHIPDVA